MEQQLCEQEIGKSESVFLQHECIGDYDATAATQHFVVVEGAE